MLAWYVNGRLSEEERGELERGLGPDLRAEVAEFRALRAAVADVGDEEPRFPPNLVQDAWRQIQVYEREKAARAAARPAARLAQLFDAHIASLWRNATGVGRLALAAQRALVLGLGAALLRAPAPGGVEYGTTSGPEAPGPAAASAPAPPPRISPLRVKVMFAPEASQQAVAALLLQLDAEIVGGPSNQGLYTVSTLAPTDPGARASALDVLVRKLEAQPALVRGVVREAP